MAAAAAEEQETWRRFVWDEGTIGGGEWIEKKGQHGATLLLLLLLLSLCFSFFGYSCNQIIWGQILLFTVWSCT